MSIAVTRQQSGLEENHAGIPDRRRPAKPRQDHLGDHRLEEEHQRGADEQGDSKQKRHADPGADWMKINPMRLRIRKAGSEESPDDWQADFQEKPFSANGSGCETHLQLAPERAPD